MKKYLAVSKTYCNFAPSNKDREQLKTFINKLKSNSYAEH